MNEKYNVYLISDSTGETLDRIFLSLKSQFSDFIYDKKEFVFVRTEQQIDKIIKECKETDNSIILYTIVETKLAKYISNKSEQNSIPCFGILGNLILSFSKLLNQKASHTPSAQHVLDDEYYKRIEAIQFTMSHDDGKKNLKLFYLVSVEPAKHQPPFTWQTEDIRLSTYHWYQIKKYQIH